ncbi:hypothetical protein LZ017_14505 [Pelomonas sp. CA6]|uniref:hypothetical protein n=1 Tax=Pelomonas sp. CA6 TaxID=2907999 RepID=UPI001F4BD24C|nr:hypothetical protein [Pelomonas sp. CA6]MCH7344589.1 hypothetical protein [Pelomonas sp. CA6]
MTLKSLAAVAALLAGALALWWWQDAPANGALPPQAGRGGGASATGAASATASPLTPQEPSEDTQKAQMAYLAQTLKDAGKKALSPEELRQADKTLAFMQYRATLEPLLAGEIKNPRPEQLAALSEQTGALLDDHYLLPPEAIAIKQRLLEIQYQGQVPNDKRAELQQWAADTMRALAERDDPRRNPQYLAWQRAQQEVTQRVTGMSVFPDGMSRDQYLIQEMDKAHRQIYGTAPKP